MGQHEHTLNVVVGQALDRKGRRRTVHVEETGIISRGRADILVHEEGRLPVIIETEFAPGRGVEMDACRKIGVRTRYGDAVRTCVSVVVSRDARDKSLDGMRRYFCSANDIRYAIFSLDRYGRHAAKAPHPAPNNEGDEDVLRYPDGGWLEGSLADIMLALQAVSVPASNVEKCVSKIHQSSAAIGEKIALLNAHKRKELAALLNQPASPQTWQMAALILNNAMVFYDEIASTRPGARLRSIDQLRDGDGVITAEALKAAWRKVLGINYYPIFKIALELLKPINMGITRQIADVLVDATDFVRSHNLSHSSDLYGTVMQRMISDRERLATYYTLPESAEMMASIVLPPVGDPAWRDKKSILSLRVADLACGTGMLLATTYRQIIARYGAGGGRGSAVHEGFMRDCISGLDVLPLAAHMTVSSLAGVYPDVAIRDTNIHHMPIGRWGHGRSEYRLGSLDLIDDRDSTLFESSRQVTGSGEKGRTHHGIADGSLDLIVMNPPFTKSGKRKRREGGGDKWDAVAPFAAFGAADREQEEMGRLARKKFAGTCAHGHAGLGSYFVAVCDKKLRPGGTMALILPATIASGESWSRVRALLRDRYDTTVLSIANEGMGRFDGAFSSDTGMLEVMLVARKRRSGDAPASPVFVTLRDRPLTPVEGAHVGESIRRLEEIKAIEEGHGATPLVVGRRKVGHAAAMDVEDTWPLVNVREPALLGAAYALRRHHGPDMFTTLGRLCEFGPDSQLLIGAAQKGPFAIRDIDRSGGLPEYHALWNNDHEAQRTMLLKPDKAMDVKKNASDAHVRKMWSTASHVHVNLDPRYTAQSILASFVGDKTAGGTAWPSLMLPDADMGKAFVMWHNSTFGILSYWMVAGRQQLGRGRAKRSGAARMSVPNLAGEGMAKSVGRLAAAFDRLSSAALSPISGLENDAVRHQIDRAVAASLGMRIVDGEDGEGAHGLVASGRNGGVVVRAGALRRAMALEPSIRGVAGAGGGGGAPERMRREPAA